MGASKYRRGGLGSMGDCARPGIRPEGTLRLLFCIDGKFTALFQRCLASVVRSGGYGRYEAYILHSDLTPEQVGALERACPAGAALHFLPVPEELFRDFPETGRYPRQIYYRLAAPLLLPRELERVLYLDVDTVVINPLSELYETDFQGNLYVGCTHTRRFLTRLNQARLRSEKAVSYINTGVLLLNLPALRTELDLEDIRRYTAQRRRALVLPDQDILTALYGDRVKLADSLRYNLSDRILAFHNMDRPQERIDLDWVRRNGVIIHYCGKNKPWNEGYTGILGTFYNEEMR